MGRQKHRPIQKGWQGLPDVEDGHDEQPDRIHQVPVHARALEGALLMVVNLAGQRLGVGQGQTGSPNQHVSPVQPHDQEEDREP